MEPTPHILVVDDSADIREPLAKYLAKKGLRVSTADGGQEMRRVMKTSAIDLVVLDIMMPGEDGLVALPHDPRDHRRSRSSCSPPWSRRPTGWSASRSAPTTTSPSRSARASCSPGSRPCSAVRGACPAPRTAPERSRLRFDRWTLDTLRRELVGEDGVAVPLSTTEFRLLTVFLERPRMVLSRDQLLDLTSGRSLEPFERSIDNQVSRLRKKIESDPKNPAIIKTVWGGGYVLAAEVAEAGA